MEDTHTNLKDFDFGYYTKTNEAVLKIVEKREFKGYEKHFLKNSNGDYNHRQNFFIWKKKNTNKQYLRICLISKGWNKEKVFYWVVDFNFKPFNKKKCDKWESEKFKGKENNIYLKQFEKSVLKIREFLKGGLK